MAYAYANLKSPRNTASGVAEYALIAPVTSFTDDGIKCPEAPFTLAGDEVTVKEAHEFVTGEGFLKVQLAPEKNKLDAATIGDKGFSKLDMTLEIFIPGSYAELHEAVKNLVNIPLIALIKDGNCDENFYYQLGCDCASAWLTVDFSTGTTKDGVKGYTGKLTYQNGYMQIYKGPAPTIKSDTVTPTTYDNTLTFIDGDSANAQGVAGAILLGTTDANVRARFNTVTPHIGLPVDMTVKKGGIEQVVLTYAAEYASKPVEIRDKDGIIHLITFLAATGDKNL